MQDVSSLNRSVMKCDEKTTGSEASENEENRTMLL